MPIELDPTTDVGMVRLLIADVDPDNPLFQDAQIEGFLGLAGSLKRAAADALDAIARSEVLISKKITTQDLATDGPAVARELRESAKALRDQAADDANSPEAWAISVIDFDPNAAYRCWG